MYLIAIVQFVRVVLAVLSVVLLFADSSPVYLLLNGIVLSFSIFLYFCFYLYCEVYYGDRKTFNSYLQFIAVCGLVLGGALVSEVFAIPDFFLYAIGGAMLLNFALYLPYLIVLFIAPFFASVSDLNGLKSWKKLSPYNLFFVSLWKKSGFETRLKLLQLEKGVHSYSDDVLGIISVWIVNNGLSMKSLIDQKFRKRFLFIDNDKNNFGDSNKVLSIEQVIELENEIEIIIRTEGDFVGADLVDGKTRAKLLEYFAAKDKPLRSLSYNPSNRKVLFQFYSRGDGDDNEIISIAQKIEAGFTDLNIKNSLNVYPQFLGYEIIDSENFSKGKNEGEIYAVKLKYRLPAGLSVDLLNKSKIDALAAYIRHPLYEHKLKPHDELLDLFVEIKPRALSSLTYRDFPPAIGMKVPLGFDYQYRRPVFINFDQSGGEQSFTPHLLVAGATASGKSNFIKFLILQFIRTHTPDDLRLLIVDPKVVTFRMFKHVPHLYAPIISDTKKFQTILLGIVSEVENRYRILEEYDAENIVDLAKKAPEVAKKMPKILVIVDEFADIIDSHSWNIKEDIILTLKRLGQKARAAGVHLILITQRATSANIDSEIKANISGRISFRVASEGDSQVVIENPDAAHVEKPGEGYARMGDTENLIHFQAPYLPDEDLNIALEKYKNVPIDYVDKSFADELLKKPLKQDDVNLAMLNGVGFPQVNVGVNLNSHNLLHLLFSRDVQLGGGRKEEPTSHVLIAGATNSGKSRFAKLLIYQLLKYNTPDLVKLIIVDPKSVSFNVFKNSPFLACPIVTKHQVLLPILQEVLKIIEKRYELFSSLDVENIEEYRLKTGKHLSSLILVIDEFADLLDSYDYQNREEIERILKRYGQMARAAGVHLVVITQRATSQNIPSEIRTCFAGRMAFRMNTEADSYYILEESGAEKIEGAGHFLLKKAHYPLETGYVPLIDDDAIRVNLGADKLTSENTYYWKELGNLFKDL